MRDIALARLTGSPVHFLHLSTAGSVELVRAAKAAGLRVTAEAAPHHFLLTDACVEGYDPVFKVHPPLRTDADVAAIRAGLADGTIDAIATDHAPHHADEKALEFDRAPFGIVGLETAVPICLDRLVHGGVISWSRFVELLSANPARILNVPGGTLAEGGPADVTILAPGTSVTIRADALVSKSKNTPFDGWTLKGAVAATIVGGRVKFVNPEVPGVNLTLDTRSGFGGQGRY